MNDYEIKLIGELLSAGVPVFYGSAEIIRLSPTDCLPTYMHTKGSRYTLAVADPKEISYIAFTRCRLDEKAIPVKKNRKKTNTETNGNLQELENRTG